MSIKLFPTTVIESTLVVVILRAIVTPTTVKSAVVDAPTTAETPIATPTTAVVLLVAVEVATDPHVILIAKSSRV